MSPGPNEAVRSLKLGSENAIVILLPPERFLGIDMPHHNPPPALVHRMPKLEADVVWSTVQTS